MEALAKKLNIFNSVLFYGFAESISAILSLFDIFVLSSFYEGISISLLEAMAAGIPAIVTSVGGNPEVVTNYETGLLVPSRDEYGLAKACDLLLTDCELRRNLGSSGQRHIIQCFAKESMARQVSSLYLDLYNSAGEQPLD